MVKIGSVMIISCLLIGPFIWADEIVKKDSEVLEGKIEKIEQGKYYKIRTKHGKLYQIEWNDVKTASFEERETSISDKNKILSGGSNFSPYEQYRMREISPWGGFAVSTVLGLGIGHYIVDSPETGIIFTGVEIIEAVAMINSLSSPNYYGSFSAVFLAYLITHLAEMITIFPVVSAKNDKIKQELGISFNPDLQLNKDKINLNLLSYRF